MSISILVDVRAATYQLYIDTDIVCPEYSTARSSVLSILLEEYIFRSAPNIGQAGCSISVRVRIRFSSSFCNNKKPLWFAACCIYNVENEGCR